MTNTNNNTVAGTVRARSFSTDEYAAARRLHACAAAGLVRIETTPVYAAQVTGKAAKARISGQATFCVGAVRAMVGVAAIQAIGLK